MIAALTITALLLPCILAFAWALGGLFPNA